MIKLKQVRESKGISQIELAKKIGLSKQQVYQYETGRCDMAIKNLLKSCIALGCKLSDLIEDKEVLELLEKYQNQIENI